MMEDARKTKKQMIEELTELRQSVAELKGFSEEIHQIRAALVMFNKAFRHNAIPITISSARDGKFIEASDAFLRLVELKRHEVIGRSSTELGFLTNEQREIIFKELNTNGSVNNFELSLNPQRKGLRYGLFNINMISYDNENCLLTTIQDITERKHDHEALLESEKRYRALVNSIPDIIYSLDGDGNIVNVNSSAFKRYGYNEQAVKGKPLLHFVHPEDREIVINSFLKALEDKRKVTFGLQFRIVDENNVSHWFELNARARFDEDGRYLGENGVLRNITDRKEAEAEKDKLEARNRQLQKSESLGRMAAAIAHHFNNQLGAVIGNLEMAMDELPQVEGRHKYLTNAMQSAWKAADMSGLMLTYLGQSYDTVEPLDLSRTCRKILPILKVSMPQEVVLETSFSSHGPIISTNVNHIQQILTNLINNSLEAIGKKSGAISLCVKTASPMDIPTKHRFPVDWESPDKTFACLEVKDTGCGIENKNIDQLFDPFYSDKFTGRGMGLPVVLGIVKTCNGAIAVNSSPGNGTTFSIFFPVSEDARRLSKKDVKKHNSLIGKSPSGKKEKGGTVLIVEDEEMLRDMAEAMLECFGFEALKAKDGVEALEIFGKHQSEIKFVFTDLTMPHMNGWETLTALRKLQPDIPVILASGYDLAHVMKGDHPELPQAFLSKPYNLNELRIAIDQAIRQKEEG